MSEIVFSIPSVLGYLDLSIVKELIILSDLRHQLIYLIFYLYKPVNQFSQISNALYLSIPINGLCEPHKLVTAYFLILGELSSTTVAGFTE